MDEKKWWQSKTMWAGIVALIVGILSTAGAVDLSGEADVIVEKIMDIVTGIAGFIAIYCRVTAKSKIA